MERNREARRGSMAATNGLSRRRQRSSSLRDSPEEDGPMELQETARLRERGSKKDRNRDRSRRNKRRRNVNREEGEESTEESVDDEEDDEDEDEGAIRMLPPNHNHRRSFPPAKIVRATPAWNVVDEMIGVSVPRKARSASAKRSHEYWIAGGGGEEQIQRQASTSPARPSVTAQSTAPISHSSSNVSVRKKIKTIGLKHRTPKISKSASSIQEEIEIEVAEVLYGLMRHPQCPSKQEININASQKLDSKDTNGLNNDTKNRVSSPISISPTAAPPLPAVARKRKRPRAMKYEEESTAIFALRNGATKVDSEQCAKMEVSSPKFEKRSGAAVENGVADFDLGDSPAAAMPSESQPELVKPERNTISDSKSLTEESESRAGVVTKEEESPSLKKESPPCARLDVDLEDATATKAISATPEVESKREEKFKFDLMASPSSRSSPERDGVIDFVSDPKPTVPDVAMVQKMETVAEAEEKVEKIGKDVEDVGLEEKNTEALVEEAESQKPIVKGRILDLQRDLEMHDRESSIGGKLQNHVQKQQQQPKASRIDQNAEKSAQSISLPLQMTVAGWPGGLPPIGYMPPLRAVVSMDGSSGSSTALQLPHFLHSQPRRKRCAMHFYIAQNIFYHKQFTRMNPFWPAAAGSASIYGAKSSNLNVVPPTESTIIGNQLQGSFQGKNLNSLQDKEQAEATFSGHIGKENSPAASNFLDTAQRKQPLLQQGPQPTAAANLMHGPAFIFPMSQQQAAAAAAQSGTMKSVITTGNAAPSSATNSVPGAPLSSSTTAAAAASSMSFNYPNMGVNEAQYLAILQNNGYPFSLPYHVGVPPAYREGAHAQAMPFFNGSFYSPQMIHPSHFQQQQPQKQPQHFQPQQIQQGHQNTSTSSGSSSSHKHSHTQPKQLQGSGRSGGAGNTRSFPASKDRQPQPQPQPQPPPQKQQNQRAPPPHQARQIEVDMGREGTPSNADIRVSHPRKSVYGQNFALMAPASLDGGGSGDHVEKQQHQGMKGGVELIPQAFAMSFASFNGDATAQGLDFSSMAQNHRIFQSLPESASREYQIAAAASAAAAQVAQQKKNHQISEEGKAGGDSINGDKERKAMAGKAPASVGKSPTFSRPDTTYSSGSTIPGNTVMDSSARTLGLISAPVMGNRASRSITSTATTTTATATLSTPNPQQVQQLIQLQKQQQQHQHQFEVEVAVAAAARSKASTATNTSLYSEHCHPSSSSIATKFQNPPSVPQALIQSSNPAHSPQWKNSASLASSTTSSLKNLPQQQSKTQQGHTQISFGVNAKSAKSSPQEQPLPISSAIVGSPPTSSIVKSAGGSPRTTSTGKKAGPTPTLSLQPAKNPLPGTSRKSSPVPILGNSHVTTASSSGLKPQLQQQQPQTLQQAHLIFSNAAYIQSQSPQFTTTTTSTTSATSGYYHQRPVGFPYIHAVPAAVQVKQAEQKQPVGSVRRDER